MPTCKNTLLHPDLTIWHPDLSIVHPVPRSRAVSSQSLSAHVLRTVTTATGSDLIDLRFISGVLFPRRVAVAMHRCQVEGHALEAEFMNSVLMYVKFIWSA